MPSRRRPGTIRSNWARRTRQQRNNPQPVVCRQNMVELATPHKNELGNQNHKAKPSPVCSIFQCSVLGKSRPWRVCILSVIVDGFELHQLMIKLPYTPLEQSRSMAISSPLAAQMLLILMSVAACKLAAPLLSLSTRHAQCAL